MGSISILLADDSITIQKVVGIIFGSDDYSLTIVDNGRAAIQKAQELQPDILVIDALMPGMSGYEVCEAIRKNAALATKPILLLTGSFEPFDEEKARQCGADDHIVKPFESQQIVAKIQELYQLGQSRSGVQATVPEADFVVDLPVAEPVAVSEAPFAFEQTAAIESSVSSFSTPDDPWGAFTQQPSAFDAPAQVSEAVPAPFETLFQPDSVLATVDTEAAELPATEPESNNIGASWVPVAEQTFEFSEEVSTVPSAVFEESAAEAAVLENAAMFEPITEPLAQMPLQADVPAEVLSELPFVAPVADAVTLTDEQLKAALMAASKETIERIVWEVVPDLAEAMIKEAIKRITDAK
jgi:CheY-like chemotaxis protein